MSGVFICGTDTGVGKTIVTGLLARYLKDKGLSVITQKWVQTGCAKYPEDIAVHLKIIGASKETIKPILALVNPYCFKFPSSPHLAARLENKRIDVNKIVQSYKALKKKYDFVVVEGAGGLMVPFNEKILAVDIVKKLNLPVILVAANKLGAINHTLLTIDVLKRRGIKILGLIFNNMDKNENKVVLEDNKKIVEKISGMKILGELPFCGKNVIRPNFLNKFDQIGGKIAALLV